MTWMTPLGRSTSGCVMRAVTLPEETYWPVALSAKASGSPAAVVRFPPRSAGEYAVVPFTSCMRARIVSVSVGLSEREC